MDIHACCQVPGTANHYMGLRSSSGWRAARTLSSVGHIELIQRTQHACRTINTNIFCSKIT